MPLQAFVTGGTGFLGLNLVDQLVQAGWEVHALHRPQSELRYLRRFPVQLVQGQLDDLDSLIAAMPENVDAVFHGAADVSFWFRGNAQQTRTNVEGTRNMVEAALRRGAKRFLHTSSMAVYGFQPGPYDETASKRGADSWINYFRTKAQGEEEVQRGIARGLDAVILNPANILGPFDRSSWARTLLWINQGKLPAMAAGRASFCHAEEVARALIRAVTRGRRGENYLLGGVDATYVELVHLMADRLGKPRAWQIPSWLFRVVGRLSQWGSILSSRPPRVTPELAAILTGRQIVICDKAIRELGYRPQSLPTMIEDCLRWLTAEGFLNKTV